jgi:ATP-dependent DNA helicase RecG
MSGTRRLAESVQYVKGVGPARAAMLSRLGVRTIEDALFFVPRDYLDLREVLPINRLVEGRPALVRAKLQYLERRTTRQGVAIVEGVFADGAGRLVATWFHRPDLGASLKVEEWYQLSGKPKAVDALWRMAQPKVERAVEAPESLGIVPIYPSTEGLHPTDLRQIVQQVVRDAADLVVDPLPESFRERKGLVRLPEALRGVHEPPDQATLARCRRRLVYDEFLALQLAIAIKRATIRRRRSHPIPVSAQVDRRIRRLYPFTLTPAQDRAVGEIAADLAMPRPMHRLLQGDVGSGKTAVAIYAILAAIAAGRQAAFVAPTEILARQQFGVLDGYLTQSRVRRRLLCGAMSAGEREEILRGLAGGDVDLVVGTHALLQPDVKFGRLALVVIDEQHKFGVRQRAELLAHEITPHQLVMTATPIPRTLAMTWFGDLDLTVVAERPPGRGGVRTHVVPASERDKAYEFLSSRARMGMLGLVVCPRISADESVRGALQVAEEMRTGRFRDLEVGVIHGRMDDSERDESIRRFRRGDLRVLVATVLVEVGLDIPDATVVVIENAERFGLSQLHQIRGRVGRSSRPGICFLIQGSDDPAAVQRLQALASTEDGFEIAELDAQMRGTGDLLGAKQHGFVRPRFGDFAADSDVLREARRDAEEIVAQDPSLAHPDWRAVRRIVAAKFGKAFGLALVG